MFPRSESDFTTLHKASRLPEPNFGSFEEAWKQCKNRASALLADPKTAIGLANSFGGLIVFVLYLAVRP